MARRKAEMPIFWLKCFLVVIFGILETYSGVDPFSRQPRIVIENGHLVIRSALNCNVSLSSTGRGALQLNDVAVGKLMSSIDGQHTESQTVQALQRRIQDQLATIRDLSTQVDQLAENVTDISQRMNQLVGTGRSTITNAKMRSTFSKVRSLEGKVDHLTTLLSINECSSNPCQNGGTCVDAYNGFVCQCPETWMGEHCENDVNECAKYSGTPQGCQNGGTCVNLPGGFRCDCPPNWYGMHCRTKHDDCSSASHQELCGYGSCVDEKRVQPGQPKYRCLCEPGWTVTEGSGSPMCNQDIDECKWAKCSTNPKVMCINTPGSFQCGPCPAGYTTYGYLCEDINECEIQNGGCSLMVDCINTPGSRSCGPCPYGFIGNGVDCQYQNPCHNGNNGGCHHMATCHHNAAITGTYRVCQCNAGYVGNGEGEHGCTLSTSCTPNPCQHGICQVSGQSFHCSCQDGYSGRYCNVTDNPCVGAPCQNGGTCHVSGALFTCSCPVGYTGPTCAGQRNECGGQLDGNNGTLKYPEYDSFYPHNQMCNWVITVSPEKVVNLTFDHFLLEPGQDCKYDFLLLNDGPNVGYRIMGRFCHNQLHGKTYTSTHNQMHLLFHSDSDFNYTGFGITWKAVDPVCGGELNVSEAGSVMSPGYPNRYPVNRTCSWLVQVPLGKRIQFHFIDFHLEHHVNCSFDYFEIRDGATETDPSIGKYCTTEIPPPRDITSSSHMATLLFHSDDSVQDTGFHIIYTAVSVTPGCGGMLTETQGIVTSPRFPETYERNLFCEWLIRVHPNNRLKITFTEFHLEDHSNCTYDTLEFYDGSSDARPVLGRFCGTDLPKDIISNSNQVYIRFKTDSSVERPGFKLNYRIICGGAYTELNGVLTSPNYPDAYPGNTLCLYEIRLPAGYLVNLTILNIDIEDTPNCRFDYLEVRDGDTETSPVLASLCGDTVPDSIISTYNHLWMKFETGAIHHHLGFNAQYEAIEIGCGGVIVENNRQISSPLDQDSYPHNITCTWLIRAPEGHIIYLSFSTFLLEHPTPEGCIYDYLLIEDNNGAKIGKYCGNAKPPLIKSLDNTLLLKFVTDTSYAREGFIADYSFATDSCGGTYYQDSGVIRSPNYPKHYPHLAHCVWILQAGNNRQINLTVNNFAIEHSMECTMDYLEIRNGGTNMSPLIGKYCGNENLPTIRSHSNMLRLEFKADSYVSAQGFEISFNSLTIGCGGKLTTSRGSIMSPGFPQGYSHNADCLWLISVSEGSIIALSIAEIDIEEHETCDLDHLQIFDGDSENSKSLTRLCNNQQRTGPIKSTGNAMLLRFISDSSVSSRGFHVTYETICDNILTKRRGVIESPNYPNPYPNNHNCSWTIQAHPGSNISMSFSHIFMQDEDNCSNDYVEVLENRTTGIYSLAKFCGYISSPPQTILTSTNTALVRMKTDRTYSSEGFRLEWTIIGCGGDIIDKPNGNIMSPNYPSGYPINTICEWNIRYPPGSRVEFTLMDLDIEAQLDCTYDFLKVYGGEDDNAPPLKTFCNSVTAPELLTSHGNQIFVRFHSDYSFIGKGFKASFKKLENGCGGRQTGQEGNFASPNYPNPYNEMDECDWLIEVPSTYLVMIEFYEFDMPQAANCSQGYVAIYDGSDSSAPPLLKHCGVKPEGFISSTGNQVLVRLVSDGVHVTTGFRAHYKRGCGRRLLADTGGEIQSPNYPDRYLDFANCSWILYASDLGEKVSLTITHLYIPDYNNCTMSLIVYDGDRDDSPMVKEYCGYKVSLPIVSSGSIMHVVLKNNGIFRATYGLLSEQCGGVFTSASGSFASPGYPNYYDIEMECVWTIQASHGNKVHVTFQDFNIEESDYCNSDYLEIHEDDPSGHLIGKFCGNSNPSNVTWARKLWIKFRSDDISTSPFRGFLAHYELQHGGIINGTRGIIASPGYPHKYQSEDVYEWTIFVPLGMFVSLQFSEIAIMTSQSTCYSFIQIYDGINEDAPDRGRFCGYQNPDPVVSTTNIMTIQFHCQTSYTSTFILHWAAISSTGSSISFDKSSNCSEEYILNITDTVNITSPGYPRNYPDDLNCTYLIRTLNTHHVQLKILSLDIEQSQNCQYDYLTYYYAPNANIDSWVLNKTMCYLSPSENIQLISPNNIMKLMFVTDDSENFTGFIAIASAACGGQLFGGSGVLHSSTILPSIQDSGQPETFQCEWVITVKERRTIQITFKSFEIQSDNVNVCNTNYIQFRNGAFSTSPILGTKRRHCGQTIPTLPETSSNAVYIQVVYNTVTDKVPVFNLSYTELSMGCGGNYILNTDMESTVITSPNYPSSPTHDIECRWIIVSPTGTSMRIDFNQRFQLKSKCWNNINDPNDLIEYVELYDGGTENAEPIRRLCGQDLPSSELTTGRALLIKYVTAVANPGVGFNATVSIALCGGTISSSNAYIESPHYPQNYSSSLECDWHLKMIYGYQLTISILNFETPLSDNCNTTDFLEIREITPEGVIGNIINTICGRLEKLPLTIRLPGSEAHMKFKSNSAINSKGFRAVMHYHHEEGCGGELEDLTGVITSPRYPNAFTASMDCTWRISAHEGRMLTFTFEDLNLPRDEIHGNCTTSYVSIVTWRTRRYQSNSPNHYCGSNVPEEINLSVIWAQVSFSTTGLSAGQGFKLAYSMEKEALCGGLLDGFSGNIQTPNFTVQNDSSIECHWRIETAINKTLTIRFSILDIPGNMAHYCRKGGLYPYLGEQSFGRLCGNYTNGYTLSSPYSTTHLYLVASVDTPFLGIRATYNTSDCGGVLNGYNASITSPGYPNNYPPGIDCYWLLKVPEGEVMQLTVLDLHLEEDCTKDYLMIRNGMTKEAPFIGNFCGTKSPAPIVSSSNILSIIFHSDEFGAFSGFRLTTSEVQRGCGGVIHILQGNITSPNYPSRYDNNVECVWTIEFTLGYLVRVDFSGRFDLETSASCTKDYLQFEDLKNGGTLGEPVKKCGSATPEFIISKTNKLRIKFHSDNQINGDGFSLNYSAVCGGNFTNQNGNIFSPKYPESYVNHLHCKFIIGKQGDYITLTFDDNFSIEIHPSCSYDYIQIFQRDESEHNSQGLFCGSVAPAQRTLQGPVILKFVTDYVAVAHGFKVHYDILNCGGLLTENTGKIASPPVTQEYNQFVDCIWHIQVEEGSVITLHFRHLEVEFCYRNTISIYDGPNESAPRINLCVNYLNPYVVKSSGSQLTIRYHKYHGLSSQQNSSFSAVYYKTYGAAQGCGGILNATSGEISSVDVNGSYVPDLDCTWTIHANVPDQVIKLTFNKFDLEGPINRSCPYDYVEIRENEYDALPIHRLCGSTIPPPFIISTSQIVIYFHSNSNVNGAGFKISYNITESPCGTSALQVSTNEQILSSPNYPNPYPANLWCKWYFHLKNIRRYHGTDIIEISIKDIDVSCDGDYLEISYSKSCGSTHPGVLHIYNGEGIIFNSNALNNGSHGFTLAYKEASCSRNYTDEGGVIRNSDYPDLSTRDRCRMNITVAAGKTVALYFKHFDFVDTRACASNFLKVYHGENENATSLGTYCGQLNPNPVFSTGRSLFLDIQLSRNGGVYHITYMATDKGQGCGGKVTSGEGAFSSPLYPQAYNQSAECVWYITVPGYHTVQLEFNSFSFNSNAGCNSNYVEIFDGATDDVSSRVARYCGQDIPAIHSSESNQAVVKLVTDESNDQSGFLLYFSSNDDYSSTLNIVQSLPEPEENLPS